MGSIPLPALQLHTNQGPSPLEMMGQMINLRNAQQQSRAMEMDNAQRELQMKEQQTVRDVLGQTGGDIEKAIPLLAGKVNPQTLLSLEKSHLETRKTLAEINDKELATQKYKNDQYIQLLNDAKALPPDQYAAQWPTIAAAANKIHPEHQIDPSQPIPQEQLGSLGLGLMVQDQYFKSEDNRRAQEKAQREKTTFQTELPGKQADADQKQLEQHASALASATSADDYKQKLGELPYKFASRFPQSYDGKDAKTKQAILNVGMTPYQQTTAKNQQQRINIQMQNAGAGAGGGGTITPVQADPESNNLMAAAGISMPAFYALTGDITKLPRDKVSRSAAMKEAQDWAIKHNVDNSTMASQYKTYNEVLSKNIERVSNTKIMEQELEGTIDNLKETSKQADFTKLRWANVLRLWAGEEVNDPIASQYAMHLNQLRSELSGYNAATQGRSGNNITLDDKKEADRVLKEGIATGSLQGLQNAVKASTAKMDVTLGKSVHRARKAVWDLFGVGDKYKGGAEEKQQSAASGGLKIIRDSSGRIVGVE